MTLSSPWVRTETTKPQKFKRDNAATDAVAIDIAVRMRVDHSQIGERMIFPLLSFEIFEQESLMKCLGSRRTDNTCSASTHLTATKTSELVWFGVIARTTPALSFLAADSQSLRWSTMEARYASAFR